MRSLPALLPSPLGFSNLCRGVPARSIREQALSGLERGALFVFVGRRREFAAVKRARDFLHFLDHLDFPGEGQRRRF